MEAGSIVGNLGLRCAIVFTIFRSPFNLGHAEPQQIQLFNKKVRQCRAAKSLNFQLKNPAARLSHKEQLDRVYFVLDHLGVGAFWGNPMDKNVFGTYIVDKKRIYFENIYVDFI